MKIVKFSQKKSSDGTSSSGSGSSSGGSSGGGGGYSPVNDWFYIDADSIVHCRYDFAGDGEVSAFSDSSAGPSTLYQIKTALQDVSTNSTTAQLAQVLLTIKDLL